MVEMVSRVSDRGKICAKSEEITIFRRNKKVSFFSWLGIVL